MTRIPPMICIQHRIPGCRYCEGKTKMEGYSFDAERKMIADCAPFLKEGETPAQRIERERRDTDAVLTLLIREKKKNEELLASIHELRAAVEAILEDGHMNTEHLGRLRAAWEA